MRIKSGFAVLWAVIILAVWTIAEWRTANNGKFVEFAVTGYDPRDLLSGHYVIYQVDYGNDSICKGQDNQYLYSKNTCLCLSVNPADNLATATTSFKCDTDIPNECTLWIKGNCEYSGRFVAGIERFYIPEAYSAFLNTVPADTRVVVSISATGRGIVRDLTIAGGSVESYVEKKRAGH